MGLITDTVSSPYLHLRELCTDLLADDAASYEKVIDHATRAIAPGGRLVIADLKKPDGWPLWLVKLAVLLTKPFGVSLDLAQRKPWQVMTKYFAHVTVTEFFGGFVYVAQGERS